MVSLREIDMEVNGRGKKSKKPTRSSVRRKCPECGEAVYPIETATTMECPECGHESSKTVAVVQDVKRIAPNIEPEYVAAATAKIAETEAEYTDQEREFADLESGGKFVSEEGQARQILKDFSGDKGISGLTDMTPDMVVLFTQIRLLDEAYPGLELDRFPGWFEVYRLNVNRQSRREQVETTRGSVPIMGQDRESGPQAPNRGW